MRRGLDLRAGLASLAEDISKKPTVEAAPQTIDLTPNWDNVVKMLHAQNDPKFWERELGVDDKSAAWFAQVAAAHPNAAIAEMGKAHPRYNPEAKAVGLNANQVEAAPAEAPAEKKEDKKDDKKTEAPKKAAKPKAKDPEVVHCPSCGSAGPWTVPNMTLALQNVPVTTIRVDGAHVYDDTKAEGSDGWDTAMDAEVKCNKCGKENDVNALIQMAETGAAAPTA